MSARSIGSASVRPAAGSWSRRKFVIAGGVAVAWPWLASPVSAVMRRQIVLSGDPFQLGVASGDPSPDGFVIWTRLAPEPHQGGGMPPENVAVDWEIADDEHFRAVVARGTELATPELAHSVHVEIQGLPAGRWYWYRFMAAGATSPIGRARTAPASDETPDRLRLAFASCQHFEAGYYTAYEHMAREDLDLILHLGDYMYEYAAGKGQGLVRRHGEEKCRNLAQYRNRYALYRSDKHLQAAHALCPWIVTWDDHEVENDYANGVSFENPKIDPVEFLAQRAQAYQAYYEHMPLRRAQFPQGPSMQLYRRARFGKLVEFSVLDERQYRTAQPCGNNNKSPCDETFSPTATLLGATQEQWLYDGLKASPTLWNALANQVMMARVDREVGEKLAYSMDQWPGYEQNRQRMLKFFAESGVANPVVLTGDIHSNWVNDLQVDSSRADDPVVATEFVGTSISSQGDGSESNAKVPQVLAENPFVKFLNLERGYVSCEVTPTTWTSHYRTVPYVTRLGAPLNTRKSFVVETGRPGAQAV
jgi:alkaline phosphatase D